MPNEPLTNATGQGGAPPAAAPSGFFPPAAPAAAPGAPAAAQPPGQPAPAPAAPGAPAQPPQGQEQFAQQFQSLNNRDHQQNQRERVLKSQEQNLLTLDKIQKDIANGTFDPNDLLPLTGVDSVSSLLGHFSREEPAPQSTDEKIDALTQQLNQQTEDRADRERDVWMQNLEGEMTGLMQTGGDNFRLINHHGAHGNVFDVWKEQYEKTGQLPDWNQIATKYENDLAAQGERWREILTGTPGAPPAQPPARAQPFGQPPAAQTTQPVTTLTNNMSPPQGRTSASEGLTEEQAKARAADLLRWN